MQLDGAGADALVLFNRFYQPDFDIEELDVGPRLALSRPEELLLRLHWVAILYGDVQADLAVTGGIHSAEDVLKSMMAGAQVAMTVSTAGQGHRAAFQHSSRTDALDGSTRISNRLGRCGAA